LQNAFMFPKAKAITKSSSVGFEGVVLKSRTIAFIRLYKHDNYII